MMSTEFLPLAQRLADIAADGGISVAQLTEIATAEFGQFNCYPGKPDGACYPLVLFVALHGQLRKGRGPISTAPRSWRRWCAICRGAVLSRAGMPC